MKMNKKGFTLIELLVTIAVLGILTAIAIPLYSGYQRSGARQEATTNLQGLSLCLEQYYAENAKYTPAINTTYTWVSPTNNGLNWLSSFNPKKAVGTVNNYQYAVTAASISTYTATATPVSGPVVNDGWLKIDNNGNKTSQYTGKWPK